MTDVVVTVRSAARRGLGSGFSGQVGAPEPAMTTLAFLAGTVLVGGAVYAWMEWSSARDRSQMLRAVARIKHQERLRSRTPDGSTTVGSVEDPQQTLSTRAGEVPPALSVEAAPAHPAPAGTDTAHPRPSPVCARRANLVGAVDHPTTAPTTPTPAGAGRYPHTPAPAGPQRHARKAVHG